MTLTLDHSTLKKLVVVKQVYQNAVGLAAPPYTPGRAMLALIQFDFANETALKATLSCAEPGTTIPREFGQVCGDCDKAIRAILGKGLPFRAQIQAVHDQRNLAQHVANPPSEMGLNDCRTHTHDFLDRLISAVWGQSFDTISLAGSIGNAEIRQSLIDAESALANADYQTAVKQAAIGLETAIDLVRQPIVGRRGPTRRSFGVAYGLERTLTPDRDSYNAFQRMQDSLTYTALGLGYLELMRCRLITGLPSYFVGASQRIRFDDVIETLTPQEAEQVVLYCVETVAQIEQRVGSFDRPFGVAW